MTQETGPLPLDKAALLPLFATGWALDMSERRLEKTFLFKDFRQAFRFMTQVAEDAEEIGHHPDWSNSYRTVKVSLTTHDAKGLTGLDLDLAQRMDKAAGYKP